MATDIRIVTETDAMTESPETSEPEIHQPDSAVPARRASKFLADLSRAMQAAAENARSETMTRFETEAKGVVEAIQAGATDEAAELRRTADDDMTAIREWAKAEIARIREETDARIAERKSALEGEMELHAATIGARTERVATVVTAFETQMTAFFERLNAEEDPTRIATMAETMPEPPSLADVAASVAQPVWTMGTRSAPAVESASAVESTEPAADEPPPTEFDFAAAEAEAASFSGDLDAEDDGSMTDGARPESDVLDSPEAVPDIPPAPPVDLASTRVIVSGLVSVANIANFKRSLARTPGVSTIAVASGPDGDFVFTVGHTLGTGLSASVRALPGFDIQISDESDGAITVAAQDRDATD
jgi:hypothetical protein